MIAELKPLLNHAMFSSCHTKLQALVVVASNRCGRCLLLSADPSDDRDGLRPLSVEPWPCSLPIQNAPPAKPSKPPGFDSARSSSPTAVTIVPLTASAHGPAQSKRGPTIAGEKFTCPHHEDVQADQSTYASKAVQFGAR